MMEKRLKIFLVASLFGILLLMFLSHIVEPQSPTPIANITNKSLDQQVMVVGLITSVRDYNNNTFHVISIKDSTGNITAIASYRRGLHINSSADYKIIGKVEEYNSTLQINAGVIQPLAGNLSA